MKKITYVFSATVGCLVLFTSCGTSTKYDLELESTEAIVELNSDTGLIGIPNELQKKTAYLIQMNISGSTISGDCSDFITTSYDEYQRSSLEDLKFYKNIPFNSGKIDFKGTPLAARTAAARAVATDTIFEVGNSHDFYAQNEDNSYNSQYAAGSICKAVGEHCYIWYKEKSGISIQDSVFTELADKFDSIFEEETYLFGSNVPTKEWEEIITVTSNSKIHILVYDLFDDLEETKESGAGTFGYFYSADMLTNECITDETKNTEEAGKYKSNELELINIDSYFLSENDSYESCISTLAHEFQHLLNFVNKTVNVSPSQYSSTWFNEMMSMVCEDIMQTQLEVSNIASPRYRLGMFNAAYDLGFTTWFNANNVYYSYANAYAFGAYLLRNFGIDFIRELAQNVYVDESAITNALVKCNCSLKSFDEAFYHFYEALLFPDDSSKYTLYKDITKTYTINNKDVSFVSSKINLFDYVAYDLNGAYKTSNGDYIYGPAVLGSDLSVYYNLYPTGIQINYLGQDLKCLDVSEFDFSKRKIFLVFK